MEVLYIIVILVSAVACVVVAFMLASQRRRVGQLTAEAEAAAETLRRTDAARVEAIAAREQERIAREQERMARVKAETELEAERRSVVDKVRSQQDMEKALREQFRNLAGDVLAEQGRRFKDENRESMDLILKPFKDNITDFRKRVEDIYSNQTKQSGEFKNELRQLMELNNRITTETTNLTNALKGNSKVQGDYGEVILDSILDGSGLTKGIHYQTQYNVKGDEGKNMRPDVVVLLPDNQRIVVDSKVSLTDYVRYSSAETEAERRAALEAHVASVRRHVKELSDKEYQKLVQSPDFVIMFIPNEPAFLAALQSDNNIWNEAYDRKVVLSSPTNMFALLKLVSELWRQENQSRNQEQIIKCGVAIYEQLTAFETSLEGVGQSLDQARAKYEDAYKRVYTGNNNIVRIGERMRKLGLKTQKFQSQRLLDEAAANDSEELSNDESQLSNAEKQ